MDMDGILEILPYLSPEEKQELVQLLSLNRPELYWEDPVGFAYFRLNCYTVTPKQREAMESVRDNKFTLLRAANAVGKGFSAAMIGLWFFNHPEETKVILTAPPAGQHRQLKLVWGEVEKHIFYYDPNTQETKKRVDLLNGGFTHYLGIERTKRHFFKAYTIPTTGKPKERQAKFSGEHAPRILYIVDECDAVFSQYPEILEGIRTCMAGGRARFVGLFNPRSASGPVYEMERAGEANVIEMTAFDHPNVVKGPRGIDKNGYPIEHIPGAVTRQVTVDNISSWSVPVNLVDEDEIALAEKQGVSVPSRYFKVPEYLDGEENQAGTEVLQGGVWRKVSKPPLYHITLARYGLTNTRQLLAPEIIERAIQRKKVFDSMHEDPLAVAREMYDNKGVGGLDIADEGLDENVFTPRFGGYVSDFIDWNGVDPNVGARYGWRHSMDFGVEVVNVDGIGVGAGVASRMTELLQEHNEIAVRERREPVTIKYQKIIVSEKTTYAPVMDGVQVGQFKTVRDELLWLMALWLQRDPNAMLPDAPDLIEEGAAFEYFTVGKNVVINSTRDIRKTIGRSPDRFMSLALTFYAYRNFVIG